MYFPQPDFVTPKHEKILLLLQRKFCLRRKEAVLLYK